MVKINIHTDNAAFEGEFYSMEVSMILSQLAERIRDFGLNDNGSIPLRDSNGNRVGELVHDRNL